MIKKEYNLRSESYYPDSNYYIDQGNTTKENPLSEPKYSKSSSLPSLTFILRVNLLFEIISIYQ